MKYTPAQSPQSISSRCDTIGLQSVHYLRGKSRSTNESPVNWPALKDLHIPEHRIAVERNIGNVRWKIQGSECPVSAEVGNHEAFIESTAAHDDAILATFQSNIANAGERRDDPGRNHVKVLI